MGNLTWHHFAHCPLDERQCRNLLQYALTEVLTEAITIPGRSSVIGRRATVPTKVILRRSFRAILAAHRTGLSMDGNFTGSNFVIDPEFFVKLDNVHFIGFSKDQGEKDYCQFIRVLLNEVFIREPVPPEVIRWLQLISKGIQRYEYVISYHNSMMEHRQAISTHMSLYVIFVELKHTNPSLYKLIISWLPQYDNWQKGHHHKYCINELMNRARRYVNPKTKMMTMYHDDIRGILKLVRNCWQHPGRFFEAVLTLIISVDFPSLLSDFQEVMFDAAQLGKLNLESTMV